MIDTCGLKQKKNRTTNILIFYILRKGDKYRRPCLVTQG